LNTKQFANCFTHWIQAVTEVTNGDVIAIDGKTFDYRANAFGIGGPAPMTGHAFHGGRLLAGREIVEYSREIPRCAPLRPVCAAFKKCDPRLGAVHPAPGLLHRAKDCLLPRPARSRSAIVSQLPDVVMVNGTFRVCAAAKPAGGGLCQSPGLTPVLERKQHLMKKPFITHGAYLFRRLDPGALALRHQRPDRRGGSPHPCGGGRAALVLTPLWSCR